MALNRAFPISERNLILTGYIEPNKPRTARLIAETLGMRYVDVDQRLEQLTGFPLSELRGRYGEKHLQSVESDLMAEIVLHRHTVIRVNGSMLLHKDFVQQLVPNSIIICLVARLDAVLHQTYLSLGARYHDPAERARVLGDLKREWAIRNAPDVLELDVTTLSIDETVQQVIALWQAKSLEKA
ncbi:hypothetical protein MASR2M15_00350 [Anaerolineales bacterium]